MGFFDAEGERPGALFTSSLSVSEFALLSDLGPVPLGLVMGASVHQIGWQYLPAEAQWGGHLYCALDLVANAWDRARKRAFDRLAEEARLLGADVVLGVRLRRGEHDWARRTVDYVVAGTGVRCGHAGGDGRPVLSDLSVQDYSNLTRGGWGPAGLVAASAVFFISQSTRTQRRRRITATRNQELTAYSEGFSEAREHAVRYLRAQARAVGATGIVGVRLQHRVSRERIKVAVPYGKQSTGLSVTTLAMGADAQSAGKDERKGIVVTIHAVGTAIRPASRAGRFDPESVVGLGARG